MPDRLPVHLNRADLHSLGVPAAFETDDSFVVAVQNHGEAARIHVHLDGDLSEAATVETTNHYVRANETTEIPVAVQGAGTVHGKLKLVSGYGAVTRWVDVTLTEPEDDGVVVDEELNEPQPDPPEQTPTGPLAAAVTRPVVPVVGLGVLALLVAVVAAVVVEDAVVAVGAVAVVLAVVVAAAIVLR